MNFRSLIQTLAATAVLCTTMAAAPAQAAVYTYSDATCLAYGASAGTNPGDLIVTCTQRAGVTCTVVSSRGPAITPHTSGTTLTATCLPNTYTYTYSWTAGPSDGAGANPGGCGAPVASTSATQSVGGATAAVSGCVYTVTGDAGVNGSAKGPVTVAWNDLAASTTTLVSSINPSTSGVSVTFTATVVTTSVNPTGTVNFTSDGITLSGCGTKSLSGSGTTKTATCATSSLSVAVHSIVATYAGDAANTSSVSSPLTQTVQAGTGGGGTGFCGAPSWPVYGLQDLTMPTVSGGASITYSDQANGGPGFYGDNATGGVYVGKLTIPPDATGTGTTGQVRASEYAGSTAAQEMTISTQPCDFRTTLDPAGITGPMKYVRGSSVSFGWGLTGSTSKVKLAPGATYYVNIRHWSIDLAATTCSSGAACDILTTVVRP